MEATPWLPPLVGLLALAVSLLAGWLGIGGGILLAPGLLYLPPALGLGALDAAAVTGLTVTQGVVACAVGAASHRRHGGVHPPLVAWVGVPLAAAALAGACGSAFLPPRALVGLLAACAATGAGLLCVVPPSDRPAAAPRVAPLPAAACGAVVGALTGAVGQGGSFLLVPVLVRVLRTPLRVALGSNLAIVALGSAAGLAGKALAGHVPWGAALWLAAGAAPGAWLGGALSGRTPAPWLRRMLAVLIGAVAVRLGWDAVAGR